MLSNLMIIQFRLLFNENSKALYRIVFSGQDNKLLRFKVRVSISSEIFQYKEVITIEKNDSNENERWLLYGRCRRLIFAINSYY